MLLTTSHTNFICVQLICRQHHKYGTHKCEGCVFKFDRCDIDHITHRVLIGVINMGLALYSQTARVAQWPACLYAWGHVSEPQSQQALIFKKKQKLTWASMLSHLKWVAGSDKRSKRRRHNIDTHQPLSADRSIKMWRRTLYPSRLSTRKNTIYTSCLQTPKTQSCAQFDRDNPGLIGTFPV